jgi:hypothetical protein
MRIGRYFKDIEYIQLFEGLNDSRKMRRGVWVWWLIFVIPATQKVYFRSIMVQSLGKS